MAAWKCLSKDPKFRVPAPNNALLQEFDLGMRFAESQWDEPSLAQGRPTKSCKANRFEWNCMQSFVLLKGRPVTSCGTQAPLMQQAVARWPYDAGLYQDHFKLKADL